jgi:hypothetical protein
MVSKGSWKLLPVTAPLSERRAKPYLCGFCGVTGGTGAMVGSGVGVGAFGVGDGVMAVRVATGDGTSGESGISAVGGMGVPGVRKSIRVGEIVGVIVSDAVGDGVMVLVFVSVGGRSRVGGGVGETGVAVWLGVSVAVFDEVRVGDGGTRVAVRVGDGGTRVSVRLGVSVGVADGVRVGEGGTRVAVRVGVLDGVRVGGTRVAVRVGDGGTRVAVRVGVLDDVRVGLGVRVAVFDGVRVAVGVRVGVAV